MPLTKALLEVAVAIGVIPVDVMPNIDADTRAANPSALKEQMGLLIEEFAKDGQKDAEEFLRELVNCLHKELKDGDEECPWDEKPPTDRYFHLVVSAHLVCDSCKHSR